MSRPTRGISSPFRPRGYPFPSQRSWWDGSGYPDGLAGNNIPIWAQVVSLADVYDALTSERVYKAAYTHAQAVSMILNGECGVFNPRLLNSFLSVASAAGKRGDRAHVQGTGGRTREAFAQKALTFGPDLVAARA